MLLSAIIAAIVILPSIWLLLSILCNGNFVDFPSYCFDVIFYNNTTGNLCLFIIGICLVMCSFILLTTKRELINYKRYSKYVAITLGIVLVVFLMCFGFDRLFNNNPSEMHKTYTSEATISWDSTDISKYEGKCITVEGIVVDSNYAKDSRSYPTFLDLGNPYPYKNRFVILIWGEFRNEFKIAPEKYYLNKKIKVTGIVTYYDEAYEIEVTSPQQIEVIE